MVMKKTKKEDREPVQVVVQTKRKVEKYLIGQKKTLGKFYDEAAEEKLKRDSK